MREIFNINKKNQEQRKRRVLQDILSRTDTEVAHEKMSIIHVNIVKTNSITKTT